MHIRVSCRGEKRVSGEVDVRGGAEAKGSKVIKMIPARVKSSYLNTGNKLLEKESQLISGHV